MTTRKTRDDFERRTGGTLLELAVGAPGQIQGLTTDAKTLQGFANLAKTTIKEIGNAHFRIADDATLTDGARLIRSANHATTKIKSARAELARRVESAEDTYNSLRGKLAETLKPPRDFGEAQLDAELRAWLRTQDQNALPGIVRNDPRLLAAVARSAPQATGIAPAIFSELQREYTHTVLPEVAQQFDDLKTAISTAEIAMTAIEREAKNLIDFDTAASLEGRKTIDLA